MFDHYIVFDTETSGLNPKVNEVLSISAINVDLKTGDILQEFHSLVHPSEDCVFDKGAMEVNKIDKIELMLAPAKIKVYTKFFDFIEKECPIIGYNVDFDKRMLEADVMRAHMINEIDPKRFVDILPMVRKKKLPIQRNRLSMVCEHLGYIAKFHNSLEDCKATNFVFRKLFLNLA